MFCEERDCETDSGSCETLAEGVSVAGQSKSSTDACLDAWEKSELVLCSPQKNTRKINWKGGRGGVPGDLIRKGGAGDRSPHGGLCSAQRRGSRGREGANRTLVTSAYETARREREGESISLALEELLEEGW
jgi:hypothetical protein